MDRMTDIRDVKIRMRVLAASAILTAWTLMATTPASALPCPTSTPTGTPTPSPIGTFLTPTPSMTPLGLGELQVYAGYFTNADQSQGAIVVFPFDLYNNKWVPYQLTSIRFNASGTGDDAAGITSVQLYLNEAGWPTNDYWDAGDTLLGTGSFSADDDAVTFSGSPLIDDLNSCRLFLVCQFSATAPFGTYQMTVPMNGVTGNVKCQPTRYLTGMNLPQSCPAVNIGDVTTTPTMTQTPTNTGGCWMPTNTPYLCSAQTNTDTPTPTISPTNTGSPGPPTGTHTYTPTTTPTPGIPTPTATMVNTVCAAPSYAGETVPGSPVEALPIHYYFVHATMPESGTLYGVSVYFSSILTGCYYRVAIYDGTSTAPNNLLTYSVPLITLGPGTNYADVQVPVHVSGPSDIWLAVYTNYDCAPQFADAAAPPAAWVTSDGPIPSAFPTAQATSTTGFVIYASYCPDGIGGSVTPTPTATYTVTMSSTPNMTLTAVTDPGTPTSTQQTRTHTATNTPTATPTITETGTISWTPPAATDTGTPTISATPTLTPTNLIPPPCVVWSRTFADAAQFYPGQTVMDSAENIYVTGLLGNNLLVTLLKYDANGDLVWSTSCDVSQGTPGYVTLGPGGVLYVAQSGGTFMLLIKYGPDGQILWYEYYPYLSGYAAYPRGIKMDGSGNVYILLDDFNGSRHFPRVLKYDGSRNRLGDYNLDDGVNRQAKAFKVLSDGHWALAADRSGSYDVAYFDPAGMQVWERITKDAGTNVYDDPTAVEIDTSDNILVAGRSGPVLDQQYTRIVKYDLAGTELSQARYYEAVAHDMIVDPGDGMYLMSGHRIDHLDNLADPDWVLDPPWPWTVRSMAVGATGVFYVSSNPPPGISGGLVVHRFDPSCPPTAVPTETPTGVWFTPTRTVTSTPVHVPSFTPTAMPVTPTFTVTYTPTNSGMIPTVTATVTFTRTSTSTTTVTPTGTWSTPTATYTVTPSDTPNMTLTAVTDPGTPTFTQQTSTPTVTPTITGSPAPPTFTFTPTRTPTFTPTSTGTTPVGATSTPALPILPLSVAPAPGESFLYPMPVQGDTARVAYRMLAAGQVVLRVYNAVGDLVARLEEEKPEGVQTSVLRTAQYATGVYVYKLDLQYRDKPAESIKPVKFIVIP